MSEKNISAEEIAALSEHYRIMYESSVADTEKIALMIHSQQERLFAAHSSQPNGSPPPIIRGGSGQADGTSHSNGESESEVEEFVRTEIDPGQLSRIRINHPYIGVQEDSVPNIDWLEKGSWWIPRHLREQFLGDLREDRIKMASQGYSQRYIEWSTFGQFAVAIFHGLCSKFGWALLIYNKVCDWLSPVKE